MNQSRRLPFRAEDRRQALLLWAHGNAISWAPLPEALYIPFHALLGNLRHHSLHSLLTHCTILPGIVSSPSCLVRAQITMARLRLGTGFLHLRQYGVSGFGALLLMA